jgi:hypothetical protein
MKRHFIVLFLLSFSSIALGYIDPRVPNGYFELPVEGGAKINRYTFDFEKFPGWSYLFKELGNLNADERLRHAVCLYQTNNKVSYNQFITSITERWTVLKSINEKTKLVIYEVGENVFLCFDRLELDHHFTYTDMFHLKAQYQRLAINKMSRLSASENTDAILSFSRAFLVFVVNYVDAFEVVNFYEEVERK